MRDPEFAYEALCRERQLARQKSDDVVMLHWSTPMLEVFHRQVRLAAAALRRALTTQTFVCVKIRCTDEAKPDCDTDDDWTATFRRACKNGGVPCLLDDVPRKVGSTYGYVGKQCNDWGFEHKCSVTDDVADLTPETILRSLICLWVRVCVRLALRDLTFRCRSQRRRHHLSRHKQSRLGHRHLSAVQVRGPGRRARLLALVCARRSQPTARRSGRCGSFGRRRFIRSCKVPTPSALPS